MKRSSFRLALLVLAVACAPLWSRAQVNQAQPPGQISYQGFLTDATGVPLATNTPQNFNVLFNIYSVPNGGTPLWGESQVVTVSQGYFTVLLGVGSAIPSSAIFHTNDLTYLFNTNNAQTRYIGLTVSGLGVGEIAPRLRLLASPYALLAANAINAQSVVGANTISATNLASNIGLWTALNGNIYYNAGNIGIGTVSPSILLSFGNFVGDKIALFTDNSGNSSGFGYQGGLLQIHGVNSGSDIIFGYGSSFNMVENMRIKGNGNVGIGTTAPAAMLHVNGSVQANSLQVNGGASVTGTLNVGGTLNANGISSPQFRVSNVIPYGSQDYPGYSLLPRSGTFTSGGGTLDIYACATWYSTSVSVTYLQITVDGNTVGYLQQFFNNTGVHSACAPAHFYYKPGAGTHTLVLLNYSGNGGIVHYDLNDSSQVTVTEFPF